MNIKRLDTVGSEVDPPNHGLKPGDLGAVVEVYPTDAIEVAFVTASGHTQAFLTLRPEQIRPVGPRDSPAVRQRSPA